MLDQINFMPNLIKLKHQEQCKFFVYGWDFKQQDPIKFEELFVSGHILYRKFNWGITLIFSIIFHYE
jgi:hypothetical protein